MNKKLEILSAAFVYEPDLKFVFKYLDKVCGGKGVWVLRTSLEQTIFLDR